MRILESYLIAFALMNACGRRTTDVFTVIFFITSYALLKKFPAIQLKKDSVIAAICAGIFTLCYVLGNKEALSGGLTNKIFLLFYFSCTIAGLFFLYYRCVVWVLINSTKVKLFEEKKKFPFKMLLCFAGVLFLCMIPLWLTNYPAVMTPDSLSQYRQATGINGYSDHHPWLHTMIFKLFYEIGFMISGNKYFAISCYTLVQMLLVAFSVGYVWSTLYELGLKRKYCIAGVVLFAVYPYNLIYAVTIWKDILFSMAVLALVITLFRMHLRLAEENDIFLRDKILYIVCGFLMCMLRHNGFYAFLAACPFLLWFMRKKWKQTLLFTVLILAGSFIIKGPVMDAAEVEPGKLAYKLCVPLQQVGRVIADGCELTEEEIVTVEKINIISYVEENYQKHGADPMFAWVNYGNSKYLEDNIGEYLELWISLGMKYPDKYIQAFIDLTKGYWYPMDPGQVVNLGITENKNGLESQPILNGPIVIKVHEILTKLYTIFPIYGIMYSMGAMFWLLILLLAIAGRNNDYSVWVAGLPLVFLTLTLFIAVPLVADVRYGYPLLLAIPCMVALTFRDKQEDTNEKFHERI